MPQKLKDMIENLIDRWGWELQLIITMEQCSQLSTECSHWMRWRNNSEKIEERLADMLIMCETLKIMFRFDEDELRRIMERKLTEGLKKE